MRIKSCACVVSVLLALCITDADGAPPDLETLTTPTEDLLSPPEVAMSSKPAEQVTTSKPKHKLATPADLPPLVIPMPSKPAEQVITRKSEDKLCQRRPLTVKFADLGWSDWILAPYDYDAGYCSGDCLPEKLPNTTNHAIVQALLNKLQNAAPKPCCVPTELEPVALLYLSEESNVVLRNHSNMKVKSCGCR
ncbi:bone morphogenetic protein 4-like [Cydia pomonella]|uniref:bone morphogenetic protein 4-like n=1 Tax=Cydia pomonella TaxID=82600 RepID=UPI002ADD5D86|nr:bone morphogenetic protein 4-like [Cydia pomonella]